MNILPEHSGRTSSILLPLVALGLMAAAITVEMVAERPKVDSQRLIRAPSPGDFVASWRRDGHIDLQRTLAEHKVDDCNEMAFRPHRTMHGQYLVYCTRNGVRWTSWLVSTATQRVTGPFEPDPLLPPPR